MTARALETAGIATVVIGAARDILETCGTPRVVYNDLPLGNPIGVPGDRAMQRRTVELALELIETAEIPGAFVRTPFRWGDSDAWKQTFMRLDDKDPAQLRAMGDENRRQRAANRAAGLFRT